ncbi:uncharacterized protein LOC105160269 [Sesamum indicum]|uniref:Uncharacterized protein LOC105160269 n=1 Tax=Sesamum indicum TaxID=4182 RepID=A0A6I9SY67_SESIN|nr:uncharacterized protein LOC105160269 [Sesamum indicum]
MGSHSVVKKPRVEKISTMAEKKRQVIEIGDSCSSPDKKGTPLRPIFCLKNRDDIKKFEEQEDCFILEFDPYDDLEVLKLSFPKDCGNAEADVRVVAEKGQVACRDYPHPRHTCAKYPFEKTPHDSHCKLCYCYVCDSSAPCSKWANHCHAFNNESWNQEKKLRRRDVKTI